MTDPKADIQQKPVKPFRKKSFADIISEGNQKLKEAAIEPTEPEKEPEKEVEIDEEKKKSIKEEKEKIREEREKKIAEEVARATKEELRAELEREKAEREKQEAENKKQDEKVEEKPKREFIPKWKQEGRMPKDYEEIAQEAYEKSLSDSVALAMEQIEKREKQKEEEALAKAAQEKIEKEREEKQRKEYEDQINKQIEDELSDLYTQGKLPAIKNKDDEMDDGVRAKKALFETGVKVNKERMEKGLPPITSLKLIYYEHYKAPNAQPAGADAPVMGNKPSSSTRAEGLSYEQLHKKTWRDIIRERTEAAKRSMGMR